MGKSYYRKIKPVGYVSIMDFSKIVGMNYYTIRDYVRKGLLDSNFIKTINGKTYIAEIYADEFTHWRLTTRREQLSIINANNGRKSADKLEAKKPNGVVVWTPVKDELGFEMLPEELLRLKQIRDKNGLTSAMGGDDGFTEQVGIGA